MSHLLFGAIDDINADLTRLSGAITTLQQNGFSDTHPAIQAIRERIAKLQAELTSLQENI